MKETFTQDELAIIATSLNAKIRELESAVKQLQDDKSLLEEFSTELSEVKQIQQKAFRMYKFK